MDLLRARQVTGLANTSGRGVGPCTFSVQGLQLTSPHNQPALAVRAGWTCCLRRGADARSRVLAQGARIVDPTPAKRIESMLDVDNGLILGFGSELSDEHPGFLDSDYKQRRVAIADAARAHKLGSRIPDVEYSAEEKDTWRSVLTELTELLPQHACLEYRRVYDRFGFTADRVPQLQEMNDVLLESTGWRLRPVAGLMHPRHFLAGLAFKHFHSTQYIRHHSRPDYTPEPDLCHELIGHVPMLADPACSELIQAIGQASLHARTEAEIWHLTKLYWYTVEFGVVREGTLPSDFKAFGAGILSSYGELAHMARGVRDGSVELAEFDPFAPQPRMSYKDGYQKRYFVLGSFAEGAAKLRRYADTLGAGLPAELLGDATLA